MKGNCLAENIVYLAKTEVENSNQVIEKKIYIGATEHEWKKKGTIIMSFKNSKSDNATMLSVYYQKIKRSS